MTPLSFFQKKEEKKEKELKKEEILAAEGRERKKEARKIEVFQILKSPHITEKATRLSEDNQYVFKVWPGANKTEIKRAIENLYDVDVLAVKIINIPAKKRRLGRISGLRKKYKKAIVKIKKGQTIEIIPK